MKIDFVSDVSCPWCAIGFASLQTALDRLGGAVQAELHLQPFELNPQMPPGGQDIVEHLRQKYGISAEQIERNHAAIRARGAQVGIDFGHARDRIYNTFDAHRLLHWAGLEGGPAAQAALKRALFRAYFGEGRDPGDRALLARLAGEAGLDAARADAMLASGEHADAVRDNERHWLELGIHSVPSLIVDDRHLIQGGQPPEVFEQALRQLAAG